MTRPSPLTGLIYDGAGGRMSPSHVNKRGTRYRYYVSQSLLKQDRATAPAASCRVPAADLEALVETAVCETLQDRSAIYDIARVALPDAASRSRLLTAAAELGRALPARPAAEKVATLETLISRIVVQPDAVEIELCGVGLVEIVQPGIELERTDLPTITRTIPAALKRTGMQTRLLIEAAHGRGREPDRSLLRLLARAHQFQRAMMTSQGKTMRELAEAAGVGASYFARVVRLAFLSPALTDAILQGRQPQALTANKLQRIQQLPNAWADQHHALDRA